MVLAASKKYFSLHCPIAAYHAGPLFLTTIKYRLQKIRAFLHEFHAESGGEVDWGSIDQFRSIP